MNTGQQNTKPNGEENTAFDAGGFLGNQPENLADRHLDPNAEKPSGEKQTATEKKVLSEKPVEQPPVGETTPSPKTYQLTLNEDAVAKLKVLAGGEEAEFSVDNFTKSFDTLKEQNQRYREMLLDNGTLISDKLTELKAKLERTSEEKVRTHLAELGYKEDDADEQIAIFVSNDNLERQAELLDKKTNAAIVAEETSLKESREQQVTDRLGTNDGAKLSQVHSETAQLLKEELADVDGFFGLKFGKNAEEIAANKEVFAKKIANVDYARTLMADPKAFAEYAFFQANRATIEKVLTNRGVEAGKAIVLSELQNPMKLSQLHEQLAAGEFNATAFVGESKK